MVVIGKPAENDMDDNVVTKFQYFRYFALFQFDWCRKQASKQATRIVITEKIPNLLSGALT